MVPIQGSRSGELTHSVRSCGSGLGASAHELVPKCIVVDTFNGVRPLETREQQKHMKTTLVALEIFPDHTKDFMVTIYSKISLFVTVTIRSCSPFAHSHMRCGRHCDLASHAHPYDGSIGLTNGYIDVRDRWANGNDD